MVTICTYCLSSVFHFLGTGYFELSCGSRHRGRWSKRKIPYSMGRKENEVQEMWLRGRYSAGGLWKSTDVKNFDIFCQALLHCGDFGYSNGSDTSRCILRNRDQRVAALA